MRRRPPRSTRNDTLFPYTTLFRSLPILTPCEEVTALAAADVALEARGADRLTGEQLRPRDTQIAWRPEAAAFVAKKAALLAGRCEIGHAVRRERGWQDVLIHGGDRAVK